SERLPAPVIRAATDLGVVVSSAGAGDDETLVNSVHGVRVGDKTQNGQREGDGFQAVDQCSEGSSWFHRQVEFGDLTGANRENRVRNGASHELTRICTNRGLKDLTGGDRENGVLKRAAWEN